MLVRRVAPLRNDALPALAARALPRRRIVQRGHALQRRSKRQRVQQRATRRRAAATSRRGRRATGCRTRDTPRCPVRPTSTSPSRITSRTGRFAIACGEGRVVLRQPVAREQADIRPLLEREQADAVELALEDPFRAGEPLLRERRGHRLDPFGKRGHVRLQSPLLAFRREPDQAHPHETGHEHSRKLGQGWEAGASQP